MRLTATISPSDAENQNVLWLTSNANVVTVKDGAVSAIAPGEATITVNTNDEEKTAECTVIVKGTNEGGNGPREGEQEDGDDDLKKDGYYFDEETLEFTTANVLLDLSVVSSNSTT